MAQLLAQLVELLRFGCCLRQRLYLRIHLATDIVDTRKVVGSIIQLAYRILLTQTVLGNACRFFKQTASVLGTAV